DHHDDHKGHDHDHDHHDHDGHGEFTIEYHFHCEQLDKLNTIDTQWFTHFPSTETVDVNLLTDKAQSATKLNKNSTRISL
ncbi:ZrgA family zinc uptake protein, partial [Vibrio mexicanus]|uniref:ZrgA family zinc uptake protein n=1 Tax=Vibrio mexicanus TaxID=1004326 RepID=UPI00063C6CF1